MAEIVTACREGDIIALRRALGRGLSPFEIDESGNFAFYYACLCNHAHIVEELLDAYLAADIPPIERERCMKNTQSPQVRAILRGDRSEKFKWPRPEKSTLSHALWRLGQDAAQHDLIIRCNADAGVLSAPSLLLASRAPLAAHVVLAALGAAAGTGPARATRALPHTLLAAAAGTGAAEARALCTALPPPRPRRVTAVLDFDGDSQSLRLLLSYAAGESAHSVALRALGRKPPPRAGPAKLGKRGRRGGKGQRGGGGGKGGGGAGSGLGGDSAAVPAEASGPMVRARAYTATGSGPDSGGTTGRRSGPEEAGESDGGGLGNSVRGQARGGGGFGSSATDDDDGDGDDDDDDDDESHARGRARSTRGRPVAMQLPRAGGAAAAGGGGPEGPVDWVAVPADRARAPASVPCTAQACRTAVQASLLGMTGLARALVHLTDGAALQPLDAMRHQSSLLLSPTPAQPVGPAGAVRGPPALSLGAPAEAPPTGRAPGVTPRSGVASLLQTPLRALQRHTSGLRRRSNRVAPQQDAGAAAAAVGAAGSAGAKAAAAEPGSGGDGVREGMRAERVEGTRAAESLQAGAAEEPAPRSGEAPAGDDATSAARPPDSGSGGAPRDGVPSDDAPRGGEGGGGDGPGPGNGAGVVRGSHDGDGPRVFTAEAIAEAAEEGDGGGDVGDLPEVVVAPPLRDPQLSSLSLPRIWGRRYAPLRDALIATDAAAGHVCPVPRVLLTVRCAPLRDSALVVAGRPAATLYPGAPASVLPAFAALLADDRAPLPTGADALRDLARACAWGGLRLAAARCEERLWLQARAWELPALLAFADEVRLSVLRGKALKACARGWDGLAGHGGGSLQTAFADVGDDLLLEVGRHKDAPAEAAAQAEAEVARRRRVEAGEGDGVEGEDAEATPDGGVTDGPSLGALFAAGGEEDDGY